MQVTTRKLTDISLSSEYLRTGTDVASLKNSIQNVGLLHPVTVNAEGELLAGARRFQAAQELGWDEIPVQVVERTGLEQELVSIDENLVRKPLKGLELEKCLNRGREIFEELFPEAEKVELEPDVKPGAKRASDPAPDGDEPADAGTAGETVPDASDEGSSFADVTAEKTGLSPTVIHSAIRRDALAADGIKAARSQGVLNATQTNEIIRLEKDTQEDVLPLIADKTVKDARRIIAAARLGGVEAAREEAGRIVPLPREYRQIIGPVKRVNRNIGRILAEQLDYDGPERAEIHAELRALKENLDRFFETRG
ncbi:MAG: ParB N-terminal domain-containing protein [Planctomycetota bacterium]